jgi:hypothetical protein
MNDNPYKILPIITVHIKSRRCPHVDTTEPNTTCRILVMILQLLLWSVHVVVLVVWLLLVDLSR